MDNFSFDFAFETFEKSEATGRERRIGGIVSTGHLDKQQERLIQEGLDFGPFLKSGWFNDNHLKATGKAVGEPEMAEMRTLADGTKGWYVEGYLYSDHGPADEIWSMAKSLERSGSARRLGFSVEGQITERDRGDASTVRKAIVREVAVTRCPVNGETRLDTLAKSLSVGSGAAPNGTPGDASPLMRESLEGIDAEEEKRRKKKKNRLTKSEAVAFLMTRDPRVTEEFATRIIEFTERHYGVA